MKNGFLTSEFWTTLVGVIASLLVSQGIITLNQVDPLIKSIVAVIQGLIALGAIYKIVTNYVNGRVELKKQRIEQQTIQAGAAQQ